MRKRIISFIIVMSVVVLPASSKGSATGETALEKASDRMYYAEVDNYFDQGYVQRSGGYAQARNRIQEVQSIMNCVMAKKFNLIINSNTPVRYTSPADTCGEPINVQCSHLLPEEVCDAVSSTTYHCKNALHITMEYPQGVPVNEKTKVATWTGHVTCLCFVGVVCEGQNHNTFNRGGIAEFVGGNRYTMAYVNWSIMPITPALRFEIALHEMSHTFGAVGDTVHGLCISGYNIGDGKIYEMIMRGNTNIYCDKCENEIKEYLLANY
ncbi:MAG: hypothetical protein FWG70_01640 [Oscillospiraceae bacterium]|nr:hypothetical protein [Oscillospiraceae bacterium]